MTALYLVFLIIGLVFLGMAIFGADAGHDGIEIGHIEVSHDGISPHADSPQIFSVRSVAAFLLGFGMTGLVCVWLGKSVMSQLIFGGLSGVVIGGLSVGIMYLMYTQQAGTPIDSSAFIGKTGMITTYSGAQGIAEVCVDNKHFTCKEKNGGELRIYQQVKVESANTGVLIVEKI